MRADSTTETGGQMDGEGLVRRFSTHAVDPPGRLDYWNRLAGASSAGLSVDSPDRAYRATLERWTIGDMILMRVLADSACVHRTPPPGPAERVRVHLQLRGRCRQTHLGREVMLTAGDISVCTSAAPARLETTSHEMLVMDVSRDVLASRTAAIEERFGRPTMATAPAAHSFAETALAMWREARLLDPGTDTDWARDSGEILLDLLGLALRNGSTTPRTVALPADRMKKIVEARLAEPELNAAMIAAEMGVSIRTVQLGFAGSATTPGEYIRARRLDRAAQRLAAVDGSITEIAFDLGFNDSSYFSRCFRQAYGTGPREWRALHRSA